MDTLLLLQLSNYLASKVNRIIPFYFFYLSQIENVIKNIIVLYHNVLG